MEQGTVFFLGVARPGFDTDLALRLFQESAACIRGQGYRVVGPETLTTDPDEAGSLATSFASQGADAAILQFSTFTDGRFLTNVVRELDLPLLVWSLPEPEVGGRLRLNSLTGGNLASSLLVRLGRRFKFLYRLPADPEAGGELGRWMSAAVTARKLRTAVIAEVGNPPPGFYTCAVDPLQVLRRFGTRLVRLDLQSLLQKAPQVAIERVNALIEKDRAAVKGLEQVAADQVVRSTRFTLALRDALDEVKPQAVAVRCWPEFFNEYQAAACSTLSQLTEDGIPAACEADTLGAMTMLAQQYLTGQPTYLGDLVHVDRERNTCIFWHCGAGAFSLASPTTGLVAGVQPNRNLAFALNNALKSGPVTIARFGQTGNGFRMLLLRGEALDTPNRFRGTSVEVRITQPVQRILDFLMTSGFEHHYALVWKDVAEELTELCAILGVPVLAP